MLNRQSGKQVGNDQLGMVARDAKDHEGERVSLAGDDILQKPLGRVNFADRASSGVNAIWRASSASMSIRNRATVTIIFGSIGMINRSFPQDGSKGFGVNRR